MALSVTKTSETFFDIVAATPIDCDWPLFAADEVEVYYGQASLKATLNTDYTVTLNPDDYDTFDVTPTAALLTKINALITADPDNEINYVTVRRILENTTTVQPETVRLTPFLSREIERIHMKLQQLDEELKRTIIQPRKNVGAEDDRYFIGAPVDASTIIWNDETKTFVAGPTSDEITNAQTYANNASASATAAAASATAAGVSEDNAGDSATAAAASASAAATSETNAGDSETAAAASAAAAATSETNAGDSETAAAASASAAATSETNAGDSETAAAASASAAATSETNAATSESNASTSETNAAASAAAAAAAAAEGLYNNVVTLTNADSPYVPSAAEEGTLFRLDMTGGAIVINLSALSVYAEDMKFGFVKVDGGGSSATINRGGTDTINGATSITLTNQYETHATVGDSATGSWIDIVQSTGVADDSVTNAKLANMATQTIKGRNTAGTGDPEDLTPAQVRGIAGVYSQAEVDALIPTSFINEGAEATASGSETAFDFTSLPSGVKRVVISFYDIALSGTDELLVQLGDAGGVETTGYESATGVMRNASTSVTRALTAGFAVDGDGEVDQLSGQMILTRLNSAGTKWVSSHSFQASHTRPYAEAGGGFKTLSAELDRVRVTRSGTNTFSNGNINITYEV